MKQDSKATGFVKSAGLITGAVVVVGAVGYGLTGPHSSQANPAAAATGTATGVAATSATADAVPYTPSKYPGVMVRNVPATSNGGGKGWRYVRPGTAMPRFRNRVGTRGAIWYSAGKTPAGGIAAHVSPDFYPYETATIGKDGKVHFDTVEPGSQKRQNAGHTPAANVKPSTSKP